MNLVCEWMNLISEMIDFKSLLRFTSIVSKQFNDTSRIDQKKSIIPFELKMTIFYLSNQYIRKH